jgi:hypothetical protein
VECAVVKLGSKGTGALHVTPWARREDGGIYVGHNSSVWLYRELSLAPLQHEDPTRRMEVGQVLEELLEEIGSRSKDVGQGISMLSQNRSIHIFSCVFDVLNRAPEGTPEPLEELLGELLIPISPSKTLLVGVKLRSALLAAATKTKGGAKAKLKAVLAAGKTDVEASLEGFAADYADVEAVFRRYRAIPPRAEALAQLESWWNKGQGADEVVEYSDDYFRVPGVGTYEIRAAMELPKQLNAPFAQWALDATIHSSPAVAISIRAELEPHTVTRARLRRQRRKLIAQEEEEAATGDLSREENASKVDYAKDIESYVVASRTPWLANTSILFASVVDDADETYADMLAAVHGIRTEVIQHRQIELLDEMQATSDERENPFPQDINLAMVAYAGLPGFSTLGDPNGMLLGNVDPDFVPCYIDPFAAAKRNTPPVMCIFGDPGSGKTFSAQLIAGQAAIAGVTVFFINPKGFDSLSPWVDWVRSRGVPARTVSMSKIEKEGGAFDPFSFCDDPRIAAEILARHIQTVLTGALSPLQEFALAEGLTRGADAGAKCAMDALSYVEDLDMVEIIKGAVRSYSLFALAFSAVPRDDWKGSAGLTLIEFDRELPLPPAGKQSPELTERLALAALRLTSRAAMEILMRGRGGMYVIDEAHHYIASPEGMSSMDRLAREGRSAGLLPVFITQRPSDLLDVDMESFMSRVLCMKLNDPVQARAALTLCRLGATQSRVEFLRTAGPRQDSDGVPGRPALGILRDLDDRHAVVSIGPVPEHLRLAMSTNRTDRELREAQELVPGSAPSTEVDS